MSVRAIRTRIIPGMERSYDDLHRTVPAELAAGLRARGDTEWLIFRHGQDLFHVIFTEDRPHPETASDDASLDEWHSAVAAHLAPVESGDISAPLSLVWSLSQNDRESPQPR